MHGFENKMIAPNARALGATGSKQLTVPVRLVSEPGHCLLHVQIIIFDTLKLRFTFNLCTVPEIFPLSTRYLNFICDL